jgi:hypothetical protein
LKASQAPRHPPAAVAGQPTPPGRAHNEIMGGGGGSPRVKSPGSEMDIDDEEEEGYVGRDGSSSENQTVPNPPIFEFGKTRPEADANSIWENMATPGQQGEFQFPTRPSVMSTIEQSHEGAGSSSNMFLFGKGQPANGEVFLFGADDPQIPQRPRAAPPSAPFTDIPAPPPFPQSVLDPQESPPLPPRPAQQCFEPPPPPGENETCTRYF